MLAITRREGERVFVGEAMIKIVKIRKGQVRLCIDAPQAVEIEREEVRERRLDYEITLTKGEPNHVRDHRPGT